MVFAFSTGLALNPFMYAMFLALLACCLLLPCVSPASAQEAAPQPPKEAGKDLSKQLLGCWVTDFDSAATKSFLTAQEVDDAMKKDMADTTFEFKEGQMTVFERDKASAVQITIKSQDPEKHTITADFKSPDENPSTMTLVIENDRLTLGEKNDGAKDIRIGLKRIDKQEFEKRVPEALRNGEPNPDTQTKDVESGDGYPTATPVPDKRGFVFSPYNRKVLDVTGLPSGSLVADPHFSPDEKKYFRVP